MVNRRSGNCCAIAGRASAHYAGFRSSLAAGKLEAPTGMITRVPELEADLATAIEQLDVTRCAATGSGWWRWMR
jgi:hypothetical protein